MELTHWIITAVSAILVAFITAAGTWASHTQSRLRNAFDRIENLEKKVERRDKQIFALRSYVLALLGTLHKHKIKPPDEPEGIFDD